MQFLLKKKPTAFTLIELLIVIAIISLLVSILLPSLEKAKGLAKRINCMSNLKSFGIMGQLYSNDFQEAICPFLWGQGLSGYWIRFLLPYTDSMKQSLICPSGADNEIAWIYLTDYPTSYLYCMRAGHRNYASQYPQYDNKKYSDISYLNQAPIMIDGRNNELYSSAIAGFDIYGLSYSSSESPVSPYPSFRHMDYGLNVLLLDSSVASSGDPWNLDIYDWGYD